MLHLRKNLLNEDGQTKSWTNMMKLIVAYHYFADNFINTFNIPPPKKNVETIPFLQAGLVSGQNTYTHSPLADTPALYSDKQKLIFHAEGQPFCI